MASEHSEQLLRAAIAEVMAEPETAAWELGAIRNGVVGTDQRLIEIFEELTSPEERVVTFNLHGEGVEGHTTSAHQFGQFVTRFADATKEVAKDAANLPRMEDCVLIDAIRPGSVEVTLRAKKSPPPKKAQSHDSAAVEEATVNAASNALAMVGQILSTSNSDDVGTEVLDDRIGETSDSARRELRGLAKHVKSTGWTVSALSRIRGEKPTKYSFGNRGAAALIRAIDRATPRDTDRNVIATIDGFRKSSGQIYLSVFSDSKKPEKLSAKVVDNDLYVRAARIYSESEDVAVKATIKAETKPPKDDSDVPQSMQILTALEVAGEQGSLDINE